MALLINSSTPAGSDSPASGDDEIRAFKLATRDIFGIPNNTTLAAAVTSCDADGLQYVIFQNEAVDAAAAGRLQRNAANLTWHDGTAARTVVWTATAQTLTSKTLTSPIVGTQLTLDQTTADYTLTWADPAAARAISIPDPLGTDVFVFRDMAQTLLNKTLTTPTIGSFTNATHNHEAAAGGGTLGIIAATTGTLTVARGGTSLATTPTNGQLLIGNGTNYTLATLAMLTGGGTAVTNGSGSITLSRVFTDELTGLALSNNGVDATNDIDIAVGGAASNDAVVANRRFMSLTSAITKQLDVAWAVGTNAGGLDTGVIANNTYHVFLIMRSDTGVVDALFSLSATAPTMPTGYDFARRIGSIVRSGATILAFVQDGDLVQLKDPPLDVDATNPGTVAVTRTLTVPVGINVVALLNVAAFESTSGAAATNCYISDLAVNDEAASASVAPLASTGGGNGTENAGTQVHVRTNTSAQVRSRLSISSGTVTLRIATLGWFDRRGRG